MAGQVDRPVDEDGEVEVHLDQAVVVPLVPVVGVPGGALHVFEVEALTGRQRHVGQRARAARGDRGLEHGVDLRCRDRHAVAKALVALGQRCAAGQQAVEPREQRVEVRVAVARRGRVVQRLRLLVEAQPLAAQHPRPRRHGAELHAEVAMAEADQRVSIGRYAVAQDRDQGLGGGPDLRHAQGLRRRRRLERVGAVVGIDVCRVVRPQSKAEDHVPSGHRIEAAGVGRGGRSRAAGRDEQRQQQRVAQAHGSSGPVSGWRAVSVPWGNSVSTYPRAMRPASEEEGLRRSSR